MVRAATLLLLMSVRVFRFAELVGDHPDLPCPWCRAPTVEDDAACPQCGKRFG
jgi:hypothetical protein